MPDSLTVSLRHVLLSEYLRLPSSAAQPCIRPSQRHHGTLFYVSWIAIGSGTCEVRLAPSSSPIHPGDTILSSPTDLASTVPGTISGQIYHALVTTLVAEGAAKLTYHLEYPTSAEVDHLPLLARIPCRLTQ